MHMHVAVELVLKEELITFPLEPNLRRRLHLICKM